jgi:hypothetical protein
MNHTLKVAVLLLLVASFSTAQAAVITGLEPDDYGNGVDISNTVAGTTIITASAIGNLVTGSSVFAVIDSITSTGTKVFGYQSGTGTGTTLANDFVSASLRFDFTPGVNKVTIDVTANDQSNPGQATLTAYNASNVVIGTASTGTMTYDVPITLTVTGVIDHVGLIGNFSTADNLTIPEPATIALLGLGTLTILSRRRRKC